MSSAALTEAHSILDAKGIADQARLTMLLLAEGRGDDPVALARKLVRYYDVLNPKGDS